MIRNSLQFQLRLVKATFCGGHSRMWASDKVAKKSALPNLLPKKRKIMGCGSSKLEISHSREGSSVSSTTHEDEFVEQVVCKVDELEESKPQNLDLGEWKVLVVKQNGKISAIGNKCTHYGAPLVSSAVGDGRVRCQWHGACFSLATGDIEDFPGLDSLPCYQVTVEDDNVKVKARKAELIANKRVKHMVKRNPQSSEHIIVIGGGPSGATCVEALRQEGFAGKITLVAKENCLPYDRVKVSKAMDFDIEKAEFRKLEFYKEHHIELLKGIWATGVDTTAQTVTLSTGDSLKYNKLFVATGSSARRLRLPGADLKNAIVLRNYEDAKNTNALLSKDKDVVVLGGSFVAMEAANYCQNKVNKVTVILRDELPFKPLLGPEIGAAFKKLFEDKKVNFVTKTTISKINEDGHGNVVSVDLTNGETLKADIVIMGVGSTLNTEFLKSSGVEIRPDGSIEVNEYLQSNIPNVFVGGDIAYAPVWSHNNQKSAIGHYPLAHYHGKMAAVNMLGKQRPLRVVPFFWTMLFGKGIRYAGHGSYDEIIYDGDVSSYKFVAFYLKDGIVVSASSCGRDPIVSQFAERLSQGKKLTKDDLAGDPLAWLNK